MIHYKDIETTPEGYKYELTETKVWQLGSKFVKFNIVTEYFSLIKGQLIGNLGYRSDGASWAIDTKDFAEGWFLHDILTDMIKAKMLPRKLWKYAANEMRIVNKREGMPWPRLQWTWVMVRFWGKIKPWH